MHPSLPEPFSSAYQASLTRLPTLSASRPARAFPACLPSLPGPLTNGFCTPTCPSPCHLLTNAFCIPACPSLSRLSTKPSQPAYQWFPHPDLPKPLPPAYQAFLARLPTLSATPCTPRALYHPNLLTHQGKGLASYRSCVILRRTGVMVPSPHSAAPRGQRRNCKVPLADDLRA